MQDMTDVHDRRDVVTDRGSRPTDHDRAAAGFGARTAWWLFGSLMLLATLGWGTYNVVALVAHEEHTEVTRFDATEIRSLDVSSPNGSVTVVGDPDASDVIVTAEIREGLRTTGNRQELDDDRLELEGSCPVLGSDWCSVDYTVELPPDVSVVAAADNGRITVTGMDGPLDVNADNGSVDVSDVSGSLTLENDNGRITASGITSDAVTATNDNGRVELSFLEPPSSVRATSDNGDVEVVLPDDGTAYRAELSSDNGDVVDPISTDPDAERVLTLDSDNGDVTARYGT